MADIVNGLLLRHGQVLMAHRAPTRVNYPDTWSFPGGHVEAGETLEQALGRELREEIGVTATDWRYLKRFTPTESDTQRPATFHFFAVDAWDGAPRNLGDEHVEIRWMALADAARMPGLTFPTYARLLTDLASG